MYIYENFLEWAERYGGDKIAAIRAAIKDKAP